MCDPVTAILALAGGAAAKMMAPDMPQAPVVEPVKPPPPGAQATQAPDRAAIVKANATAAGPGGALGGNSGTFLTGPSGIDPSTLNLGKNKLLGQ